MQTILQAQNTTQNTNRGPSDALWDSCPVIDIIENPAKGMYFFDDFLLLGGQNAGASVSVSLGAWAAYSEAGAALGADPQQEGGVLKMGTGNSSVGMTMSSQAGWFRVVNPATGFPMDTESWFECRCAVGSASVGTANRDFFIGLAGNDSIQLNSAADTVVAAGLDTLASTCSLLGFFFRGKTNPTDVGFVYEATGQALQAPTGLQTLSNTVLGAALTPSVVTAAGSTWVKQTGFIKLGFHFLPSAQNQRIVTAATANQTAGNTAKAVLTVYVNGLVATAFLIPTDIQSATFPSGFMCPVIAYRGAATPTPVYVDWIRAAKRASF